jgi:ABC-2 type transport system ATP-binding protein
MLKVEHLKKSFGDRVAVADVSFHIEEGETYGLLGPNGAGKTTTISMIAGLLSADDGSVVVGGQPMSVSAVGVRGLIGYVPQEIAIYPELTAAENLLFFARLQGLDKALAAGRVSQILETVGLRDRADDPTKTFSGGMQRRLNIGIGLVQSPKLLILDEPTVGVDPQSRNAILQSVEQLGNEGLAVLYTTHYMEEAERLCDRIGVMDEGSLIAQGTQSELVSTVGERDRVEISVASQSAAAAATLASLPFVESVSEADNTVGVLLPEAGIHLAEMLARVAEAGSIVRGVKIHQPDLEAVFLNLTGRALRD